MRNTGRLRSEAPARFCIPFRSGSSPPFVFRKLCQARRSPTPRPVGRKEHGSYRLGPSPGTASEICKKSRTPAFAEIRLSLVHIDPRMHKQPTTSAAADRSSAKAHKPRSRVDSSSRTDVRLPHIGQTTRSPSLTSTLPHFCSHCKYFFRLPSASSQNPTHLQGKI